MTLRQQMLERISAGLKRQTLHVPSNWARECMGTSFRLHPWEQGMLDSDAPVNVGQKSAQVGYSTTVMAKTFYMMDIYQVSCLYLLPTKTPDATDFSVTKFDPALESSEYLRRLFSQVKNVAVKRAGKASLWIRGMNSRSALKSIDPAFIVFDELDEMPADKIALAEFRQSGQRQDRKKLWKISTPTAPNFGINAEMLQSSNEHYFFTCPKCSRRTELTWPDCFVVCGDSINDPDIHKSYMQCKECKNKLDSNFIDGVDEAKAQWLWAGKPAWEPTGTPNSDIRGFYINQLYSMMVPPLLIAQWYFRAQGDISAEQELYNSMMGLPHVADGSRITDDMIKEALGGHLKTSKPPVGSKLITCGFDPGKWIHYNVTEWLFDKAGPDLNLCATAKILDEGKVAEFKDVEELLYTYKPNMSVIDAAPELRKAQELAAKFPGYVKIHRFSQTPTARGIITSKDRDNPYISTDRTAWIDCALGRFKTGKIKLPRDVSEEYKDHVKALIKHYKLDVTGNPTAKYLSTGPDHAALAQTYAEIALPLAASFQSNQDVGKFL